ncbi:hypothetical protein EE612_056705 [Oryza sativa]|nr:hypothetical protein EE612_056705 [Oryza sativa]
MTKYRQTSVTEQNTKRTSTCATPAEVRTRSRCTMVDFLIGLLRVPAGLAARVLARHGVATPGSLATLYAGARALDGAFFLVSPGPDRRLPPPPAAPRLPPCRRSSVLAP